MNSIIKKYIKEKEDLEGKIKETAVLLNDTESNLAKAINEEVQIMNVALYKNITEIQKVVEKEGMSFEGFNFDTYFNENIKIYIADGMYKYKIYVTDDATVGFDHNRGNNDCVWTDRIKRFKRIFDVYYTSYFNKERKF